MARPVLKIRGLKEFQRGIKRIDSNLGKVLRLALNESVQIIVDEAKPGVPVRTGRAKSTVKARSTQRAARVVGGGNRAPYYPWLDFGGAVGRRNSVRRPYIPNGRYIYPAYMSNKDKFREAISDALVRVASQAGIEVESY